MNVRQLLEETGETNEQFAARISDALDRDVKVSTVAQYRAKSNRIPKSWAKALGLSASVEGPPLDTGRDEPEPDTSEPGRRSERPPTKPPGAKEAPVELATVDVARKNLAACYRLVGSFGAARTGNPGVRVVTDDCADELAASWVQAAEELEFARRVVQVMGSGGAGGQLAIAHVTWVLGLLYVSGRASIDPFGGFQRKYGGLRAAAAAAEREAGGADTSGQAPQPPSGNGAGDGHAGAGAPLGATPGPARG